MKREKLKPKMADRWLWRWLTILGSSPPSRLDIGGIATVVERGSPSGIWSGLTVKDGYAASVKRKSPSPNNLVAESEKT